MISRSSSLAQTCRNEILVTYIVNYKKRIRKSMNSEIVPQYLYTAKELDRVSFEELTEIIDDEDLFNHVVNIHRKNYCK